MFRSITAVEASVARDDEQRYIAGSIINRRKGAGIGTSMALSLQRYTKSLSAGNTV